MNINITYSGSKVNVNWNNAGADLYIIYLKIEDAFIEYARTSDTFTTLSLVPFGDNQLFIRAYKNSRLIEQSSVQKFRFTSIDIVSSYEDDSNIRFSYSSYPQANGYRLYKDDGNGFNGYKNSYTTSIVINSAEKSDSYKIKPFSVEDEQRQNLCSSQVFHNPADKFTTVTIYKSYLDNMFLSWVFEGYADGFMVYSEYSNEPVFITGDGKCHCATLKGYKNDTKFKVCSFVNSVEGRIITAQTDYISQTERKYNHPEVSIIIPAYNSKDYIARSIDSALASVFDDLEIIIVNDGSTDSTQEILEWYANNYPNVQIAQKQNGGVADTRNYGINMAQGKYIAFLDNDDMIRPEMIKSLYDSITKNACKVAIAPLYRLVDSGYTTHCDLPFETDTPIDIDKYLEIMYTPGFYNCAIWNKLYDAQMVKEHPLGILKYEDVSWTPCIMSWADKFCFIKTPYYEWDRKTRPETFGNVLAKMPEDELFEHRKQAMMFFVENGNPDKKEYLKVIAKRRLNRYAGQTSNNEKYLSLAENIMNDT